MHAYVHICAHICICAYMCIYERIYAYMRAYMPFCAQAILAQEGLKYCFSISFACSLRLMQVASIAMKKLKEMVY